jgi:hypothetical protein
MVANSFIAGSLLGGLLDRETANQTNKANLQANAASIADAQRSRDESRQALTGTAGNVQTTQNAGGGFTSEFKRGSSGDILNRGDVGRAGALNDLSTNFKLNVPNLSAAQGIVDRDNALAQSGVDNAFNRAALKTRQIGSPGSSNFDSNLFRAQGDVADQLKANREQSALSLLQQSNAGDIGNLQQAITANQSQAPAIKGVGPSAAQINAQIPLAARTSDLGGATTTAVGSNLVSQIKQQAALEDSRAGQLALIRALGDQGAFSRKGTD